MRSQVNFSNFIKERGAFRLITYDNHLNDPLFNPLMTEAVII